MLDRLEKFEKRINKFRAGKQSLDQQKDLVKFGYSKLEDDSTRIIMRGDQNKFVKVSQGVEKKVRSLLESTELQDIAKTAKIVVEIVKEEP